jgi:hypothetical protein
MVTLITFIKDLILSVAILYAAYGLMCFVVRCVLRLVRSMRFGEAASNVEGSGVPPNMRQPSLIEIKVYVRQASDALFAPERRLFCARSEMREIAARTLETIDQTRALIAHADAIAAGMRRGSRARG